MANLNIHRDDEKKQPNLFPSSLKVARTRRTPTSYQRRTQRLRLLWIEKTHQRIQRLRPL